MQPCLAKIFKIELAKPGKFAYPRIERAGLEEDHWASIPFAANLIAAKIFGNAYSYLIINSSS